MTKPPAEPRPDTEAEWYRRRRAERDSFPLPAGLRLLDDEETGMEVRVPVVPWSMVHRGIPALKGVLVFLVLVLIVSLTVTLAGADTAPRVVLVLVAALASVLLLERVPRRFVAFRAEGVEVGWWPVPLLSRRLVAREIRGVFVRQRLHDQGDWRLPAPDRSVEADLWIVRPDGGHELLVGNLASAEHAEWLRGWLERRLEIEESPMRAGVGGAEGS